MSDVSTAVDRLVGGDKATLARALTAVENARPQARELLAALQQHTGGAHVVGVTGAPGVGKSTLCNALIREWRARGRRVGVIAVDPSSPLTGGAVLGDRVRMHEHDEDDGVFIRSLAARSNAGGLAASTTDVITVLDAAGMDCVLVETVGTGQSEVDIARTVRSTVVVSAPGLGDDVQAIKAGILEVADVLVVNKADLPHAEQCARQLRAMLSLREVRAWQPPVIMTSAQTDQGLQDLADALQRHNDESNVEDAAHGSIAFADWPQRLLPRDRFAQHLGIELLAGGGGHASVRMRVQAEHISFNGTCHGGVTFSLADTAFGLASNSHGVVAAAIDAHITYPRAVRINDTLTASAVEESRGRRFATYRVIVTRTDGATVATFTGTVAIIGDKQNRDSQK
ncbi:MAG: methylmalonyl Co-A mutase-associated GTPase MeaB [Gammaproteobacteria bacterium]|nr:methylmalonyl Co-A mutase-associated GTPase MeaB [Gammaproteobacteria bacterium]MDH3467199.1 methylmalonyl Co-A mutase-associated GTPase MeaB [Gammaproteobacteria bacterium]